MQFNDCRKVNFAVSVYLCIDFSNCNACWHCIILVFSFHTHSSNRAYQNNSHQWWLFAHYHRHYLEILNWLGVSCFNCRDRCSMMLLFSDYLHWSLPIWFLLWCEPIQCFAWWIRLLRWRVPGLVWAFLVLCLMARGAPCRCACTGIGRNALFCDQLQDSITSETPNQSYNNRFRSASNHSVETKKKKLDGCHDTVQCVCVCVCVCVCQCVCGKAIV